MTNITIKLFGYTYAMKRKKKKRERRVGGGKSAVVNSRHRILPLSQGPNSQKRIYSIVMPGRYLLLTRYLDLLPYIGAKIQVPD